MWKRIKNWYKGTFYKQGVRKFRRWRRKRRPEYLTDKNDPYFVIREFLKNSNATKLEGKIYAKNNYDSYLPKGVKPLEAIFTFNKKGDILSGHIPKKGKVVIKANMSRNSRHLMFIDVEKQVIDKKFLKKAFAKTHSYIDQNDGKWVDAPHYSNMDMVCFAERVLDDPTDWKVFTFKDGFYFQKVSDRFGKYENIIVDDENNPIISYSTGRKENSNLDKESYDKFIELSKIARYVYNKIGHFVRVDFYVENGKPILGEFTFIPAFGRMWEDPSNIAKQRELTEKNKKDILKQCEMYLKELKWK